MVILELTKKRLLFPGSPSLSQESVLLLHQFTYVDKLVQSNLSLISKCMYVVRLDNSPIMASNPTLLEIGHVKLKSFFFHCSSQMVFVFYCPIVSCSCVLFLFINIILFLGSLVPKLKSNAQLI